MFSNYDLAEFPIVRVNLEGGIKNKEEFIDFTNNWENLYFSMAEKSLITLLGPDLLIQRKLLVSKHQHCKHLIAQIKQYLN